MKWNCLSKHWNQIHKHEIKLSTKIQLCNEVLSNRKLCNNLLPIEVCTNECKINIWKKKRNLDPDNVKDNDKKEHFIYFILFILYLGLTYV